MNCGFEFREWNKRYCLATEKCIRRKKQVRKWVIYLYKLISILYIMQELNSNHIEAISVKSTGFKSYQNTTETQSA